MATRKTQMRTRTSARPRTRPQKPCTSTRRRLEDAVDDERSRLMRAHSILGCLTLALDQYPDPGSDGPFYPDVVDVARDLVNESINRLETLITPHSE